MSNAVRILVLSALSTLSVPLASAGGKRAVAPIEVALEDFTQGAAERDVGRVRRALHPEAQQFVSMPDGALQVIGTEAYVQLLEQEKIGGTPTRRKTHLVDVDESVAMVRQTREMGAMKLHDAVTLVRGSDGAWQILAVAVDVQPGT